MSSIDQEPYQQLPSNSNFGADLLGRLHQDVSKYLEVQSIFLKLESNGFVKQVYETFYNIMANEYEFTVSELSKMNVRQQESLPNQPFDFIDRYQQNSLIFKSNFQLICASISDYLWVLFFNKAQKEELAKNHSSDGLGLSPIRQTPSSPQDIQLQPQQLQASTSFSTSPILEQYEQLNPQQQSPKKLETQKRPNSNSGKKPKSISIPQDLQEKSKQFLIYDSKQLRQVPSPKSMSISNLQKNMKRVASNYPDLDRQICLLSIKDKSRSDNWVRQQFPPKQGSSESPIQSLQTRESKDSQKGNSDIQSEFSGGLSSSQGIRSQNGHQINESSRRHLFFDPTQPLLTNFVLSCQQTSQKLSFAGTKEIASAAIQSTRSFGHSTNEDKDSSLWQKQ